MQAFLCRFIPMKILSLKLLYFRCEMRRLLLANLK